MTLVILRYNVIVAGGGISGLCAGAKLSEAGIPFTIFEAGQEFYILSSAGPGPGPRSGPGQVPGQVQKVQGLRAKDLDLG